MILCFIFLLYRSFPLLELAIKIKPAVFYIEKKLNDDTNRLYMYVYDKFAKYNFNPLKKRELYKKKNIYIYN